MCCYLFGVLKIPDNVHNKDMMGMKRFYLYEGMVRLVESTVKQGTREVAVKPVFPPLEPLKAGAMLLPADHSEAFTYDLNANVLTIERKGRDDAGRYRVVDDVEMEYVGNRLSVLRDAAADALLEGSMDMPEGVYSGYDIRYDAAGRLTRDVSRGIANINYSVTGMPWVVGTMSGDCAEYGYTSSGVKLWETIYNGNRTTRREYVGPCEYVDGKLVRINVPQGYIDSLGVLHAYIRDIQGNVAGVYAAKAGKKSLEQLNDYYAYGGLTADSRGQDRNRYKHTGKELVTDLGLNSYDFTARWQSPMAGRFDVPDGMAHVKPWNSPYSFCGGDPINYVDPTGMDPKSSTEEALKLVDDYASDVNRTSVFKNISKTDFILSLRNCLENPKGIQQGKNGTCGAAVLLKYMVERNPVLLAKTAISLFETGSASGENMSISVTKDMLSGTTKMAEDVNSSVTDVIMMGAIGNSMNTITEFNPFLGEIGFSTMMTPSSLIGFTKNFIGESIDCVGIVPFIPSLSEKDYSDKFIIGLVGMKNDGLASYAPTHYIQINSKSSIWSWGKEMELGKKVNMIFEIIMFPK